MTEILKNNDSEDISISLNRLTTSKKYLKSFETQASEGVLASLTLNAQIVPKGIVAVEHVQDISTWAGIQGYGANLYIDLKRAPTVEVDNVTFCPTANFETAPIYAKLGHVDLQYLISPERFDELQEVLIKISEEMQEAIRTNTADFRNKINTALDKLES